MTSERDQNSNSQIRIESLTKISMLISHVLLERLCSAQWPFASYSQGIIWSGGQQKMMTQRVPVRPHEGSCTREVVTEVGVKVLGPPKKDVSYRNSSKHLACFAICAAVKILCWRVPGSCVPSGTWKPRPKAEKNKKIIPSRLRISPGTKRLLWACRPCVLLKWRGDTIFCDLDQQKAHYALHLFCFAIWGIDRS